MSKEFRADTGHMAKAAKDAHGHAERGGRKNLRRHKDERDAVHLKLGQRVLGEDDLRDKHSKRVAERVDDLRRQGHGPQRHLDPTDDMLKDRLGKPAGPEDANGNPLKDDDGNPRYHYQDGYVQTKEKIDPAHGPNAKERLGEDAYMDAEDMNRKHKCDSFSTAFNRDQGDAFMHADLHGCSRLDPHDTERQYIRFRPKDAWAPGVTITSASAVFMSTRRTRWTRRAEALITSRSTFEERDSWRSMIRMARAGTNW
ncbi:hypothetical protein HXP44_23645 [Streptomyces sioyaensis]|uniref:Uncharacterized protein n=1 Tax=Streptomyces sioyaensis TaxID=67364 RepID=A0A4Q1QUX0_9ACTN|nr:hypothetical protein [Streptomyces sioyaensis]MBM4794977.1 hypothetical protein [Streptomyces sioyaensis]RXS67007.1 hypothetical protein EST54_13425 [Streptomyces sioyaensis]